MSSILEIYEKTNDRFLQFSMREKVLSIASGVIFCVFGGYVWLIEPIQIDIDNLERRVKAQQSELGRIQNQVTEVEIQLKQDPDTPLRKTIESIQTKVDGLDEQLREQTVDLIPASKMPLVLEKILGQSKKLKVIEVSSIAPTRMMDISSDGESVNLFQHGVMLVVEGEYMDILNYLEEIENLEWRFYWKRFDYLVDEYPVARAEIELYTLSTNEAFIGV